MMKKPATMWPSAVPTSVSRVTICLLRGRHRVLRGLEVGVDLAVAGVQRPGLEPVPDLLEAADHLLGQVAGALRDLLAGEGQQQRDERDAADHHEQRRRPRAAAAAGPAASTSGTTSAASSSAITSGSTTTANIAMPRATT